MFVLRQSWPDYTRAYILGYMANEITIQKRLELVEKMFENLAKIFVMLGYSSNKKIQDRNRQIEFENQIYNNRGALSLVVSKINVEETISKSFVLEYRSLGKVEHPILLQDKKISRIVIQLIKSNRHDQCIMQIYLAEPLSYLHEDFVYQIKIDRTTTPATVSTGIPWISPETHIPIEEVGEIVNDLTRMFSG